MKLRETLVLVLAVTVVFSVFSTAGAASIPNWVKGVAGWWSQDKISEQEFLQGIDYLISSGAIKPKIIEEKDAKIKSLETELAKYKATAKPVQTYPELRESTRLWSAKQLTDAAYLQQVQSLVDRGIIGPWKSVQGQDAFGNVLEITASDKKNQFDQFKKSANSWINNEIVDTDFTSSLEYMYVYGFLNNPKGYVAPSQQKIEPAPVEKTESERIYEEQIAKQAVFDASHAKIMDNAKQWLYGYISTETYLENIIQFEKEGVFDPFKTTSQKLRGDVFFTEKAIGKTVKNQAALDDLRRLTQNFVNSQGSNYFTDLISFFDWVMSNY